MLSRRPAVSAMWRSAEPFAALRTGNGTLSEARSRRPVIIRSADEVPRGTLLKRFPVPRNLGVSPESRIVTGRTWPAPAGESMAFDLRGHEACCNCIGRAGDLRRERRSGARKMIFPSLYAMAKRGALNVPMIGVASSLVERGATSQSANGHHKETRAD